MNYSGLGNDIFCIGLAVGSFGYKYNKGAQKISFPNPEYQIKWRFS